MSSENDAQLFIKVKKTCESEIKEQINKIIKNEGIFCCISKDVSTVISDKSEEAEPSDTLTKYLPVEEGKQWSRNLFLEVLKSKELNPKALEQMKAKGITPKPQPMDLLLIIIVPSEKSINIGISVPPTIKLDLVKFCENSLAEINYNFELYNEKLGFITYSTEFELKELDNVKQLFFNQLKIEGIYIDDEPDEEYVNYLEGIE